MYLYEKIIQISLSTYLRTSQLTETHKIDRLKEKEYFLVLPQQIHISKCNTSSGILTCGNFININIVDSNIVSEYCSKFDFLL